MSRTSPHKKLIVSLFSDSKNEFRFNLQGGNHKIIAAGEGYKLRPSRNGAVLKLINSFGPEVKVQVVAASTQDLQLWAEFLSRQSSKK